MLRYVQRFNCNSLIMSQLSNSTQLIILLALNCTFHHNFLIYSHTHIIIIIIMTLQQQSISVAIVVALNYWCGNIIAENANVKGYFE